VFAARVIHARDGEWNLARATLAGMMHVSAQHRSSRILISNFQKHIGILSIVSLLIPVQIKSDCQLIAK
jgi:hypothetical protein